MPWLLSSLAVATGIAAAQAATDRNPGDLVAPYYTRQQAQRGSEAYRISCASCHGPGLADGAYGPPLKGAAFLLRWGGKTLDALFSATAAMPIGAPKSLDSRTYVDLLAYILQHNGVPVAESELPAEPSALARLVISAAAATPSGALSAQARLPPPPVRAANPLDSMTVVTDAMLATAPDGDWLTWRRTNAGLGYSPLTAVDTSNVQQLRVAWSWALPAGPSQVTPLVHDGVMFVHGFGDAVQALDARSGELLWEYSRWLPPKIGPMQLGKRSIAMHGKRIYLATSDAHVVALDAVRGTVVWDRAIGNIDAGFGITGGPVIGKGKVMVGTSGRAPGGNYIVGLDLQTGIEAWRFHTVASADDVAGNSWNGVAPEKRSGGSVWIPGSYDAKLGLAFFGAAPTYDTGPLLVPAAQPSAANSALYTDATLAIDPDTGKLAWHYQHLANDQWDLDWAFERHVVQLPVGGRSQPVIVTGGKLAIFDLLTADSGRYLASIDVGLQSIVKSIDPKSGAKQIDLEALPRRDAVVTVCPHADGAKNWPPSAYNPEIGLLFVPLMEVCMDMNPVPPPERGSLSSGVRWSARPRPDTDGKYGRVQALDLTKRRVEWTERQRAPITSGLLATAGGLLFGGDLDRYFWARDQRSGRQLWRIRLNDVITSSPISYSVDGRQYVAVTVGHGVLSIARRALTPEIRLPTAAAATVWVFEVPDSSQFGVTNNRPAPGPLTENIR